MSMKMILRREPLNEQEQTAVRLHDEEKLTRPEIAARLGVSAERVRQILRKARLITQDLKENGEDALSLMPMRVRNMLELLDLCSRDKVREAFILGRLTYGAGQIGVCLDGESIRNLGWGSWVVLNEWAGLPRPESTHKIICPHCGGSIDV